MSLNVENSFFVIVLTVEVNGQGLQAEIFIYFSVLRKIGKLLTSKTYLYFYKSMFIILVVINFTNQNEILRVKAGFKFHKITR